MVTFQWHSTVNSKPEKISIVVLGQTKVRVARTLSPAVARRWFLRKSKNNSWHVNNNSYKLSKCEYLKSRLVWSSEDENKKESSEKPLYPRLLLYCHSHGAICSMINFRVCTGGCWTVMSKLMVGQYFLTLKSTCSLLASSFSMSSSWRSSRHQTPQLPSASAPSSPKHPCFLHSLAVGESPEPGKSNITRIIRVNTEQQGLAKPPQHHCAKQRKPR